MTEPKWDKIRTMNPQDAYMEGYKKGRSDSKVLYDDLKKEIDKLILKYG